MAIATQSGKSIALPLTVQVGAFCSGQSSGIRPNANAVVSAMPVVKAKARARITAIFFMAVPFFSYAEIATTAQALP